MPRWFPIPIRSIHPHDYGFDDPGFFALGSTRVADFPAGTSPLPAGADVTLSLPELHRRRQHRHVVLLERLRSGQLSADFDDPARIRDRGRRKPGGYHE